MAIYLIAAMDLKYVIGEKGKMPWGHLPHDMQHFRDLTMGNIVVMGRKTFDSISEKFPQGLPGRENVVMSSKMEPKVRVTICRDIKGFLGLTESAEKSKKDIFIIGGGKIYKQLLPYASKIFLTIIHHVFEGDTFFPHIKVDGLEERDWKEIEYTFFKADDKNPYDLSFVTYERREKKVVDITFGRGEYGKDLNQIEQIGICPFCPGQMYWHKEPILKESGRWFITKNTHSYKGSAHHVLVICKDHLEHFNAMTCDDWFQVMSLFDWYCEEHGILGGGIAMRFGDTLYTGATVCHLHFHLIVPEIDLESGKAKPVYFPIG